MGDEPGKWRDEPIEPARPTAKPREITSQAEDHCPNCFRWSTWNGQECTARDCGAISGDAPRSPVYPVQPGLSNSYISDRRAAMKRDRQEAVAAKVASTISAIVGPILRIFKRRR